MAAWNRQTYTNDGGSTKTSTKPKSTPVSYSTGQNYTTANRSYTPSTAAVLNSVSKSGSTSTSHNIPAGVYNYSTGVTAPVKQKDPEPYVPPTSYGYSGGSSYSSNSSNSSGSSGSSGGGDSGSSSSNFDDLFAEFTRQSQAARDQFIAAIMKNLESVRGTYNNQIQQVKDEYQKLVNENEVKKERARRVIRENQANRGQLNSGLGRQELLDMNIGYDNITSNLNSARTKAVNDIYNLIAQAEAEAETNKANINNNYANSLLQYRLANQ